MYLVIDKEKRYSLNWEVMSIRDGKFKIKEYQIINNQLTLDNDVYEREGSYSNSEEKLDNLKNIICGTWIREDYLPSMSEEYRFYSNGIYEVYSIIYSSYGDILVSNCTETGNYSIENEDTVRIYFGTGFSSDLEYEEGSGLKMGGSVYVKKQRGAFCIVGKCVVLVSSIL